MRGTCSPPFLVRGGGPLAHRFPCAYAEASMETMVPVSHLVWAGLWTGIAADAVGRAAAFVRAAARRAPGTVPPTAVRLAEARAQLDALRQLVHGVAAEVDALGDDRAPLRTVAWALRLNNLKITASEAVPRLVHQALQVIGIAGYRNDSPYAVGRHYRDALSASLMVGNERILARNASLLLVHKDD
jgi:acyl-CoA dehydrogenase